MRRPDHGGRIRGNDIAGLVAGSREAAQAIDREAEAITNEELEEELSRLRQGEDSTDLWEAEGWK